MSSRNLAGRFRPALWRPIWWNASARLWGGPRSAPPSRMVAASRKTPTRSPNISTIRCRRSSWRPSSGSALNRNCIWRRWPPATEFWPNWPAIPRWSTGCTATSGSGSSSDCGGYWQVCRIGPPRNRWRSRLRAKTTASRGRRRVPSAKRWSGPVEMASSVRTDSQPGRGQVARRWRHGRPRRSRLPCS